MYFIENNSFSLIDEEYPQDVEGNRICDDLDQVMNDMAVDISNKFQEELIQSQTFVETLIDTAYSDDRKKKVNQMYKSTREDVKDLVSSFVQEPGKRGRILDNYEALELYWMEKPSQDFYKIENGRKVLDVDKLPLNDRRGIAFSDKTLGVL